MSGDASLSRSVCTVLVADRDASAWDEVRTALCGRGCEVLCCAKVEEALEAMRSRRPRLCVIGGGMENMDAYGLIQVLRASDELSAIPRLLLAPRYLVQRLRDFLGPEVAAVLARPASAEELAAACEKALGASLPVLEPAAGERPFGAGVSAGLVDRLRRGSPDGPQASATLWESLAAREADRRAARQALESRAGLIVVASPRGGGRTTTLLSLAASAPLEGRTAAAVVDGAAAVPPALSAVRVMEPERAVREALLRDPDVLALDMLDQRLALSWALAECDARLVLLSTRARDAREALRRLAEDAPSLTERLSRQLRLVVAQRLTPRTCGCDVCRKLPAVSVALEVLEPAQALAIEPLSSHQVVEQPPAASTADAQAARATA